jgi:hypothetical protein
MQEPLDRDQNQIHDAVENLMEIANVCNIN